MFSKKIFFLLGMLPGLRNIDGYPPVLGIEELCPAVIAGNFGGLLVRKQRKPDFKSRRDTLRPRHGDKERMEVGTIAPLRIASPNHVPVPPVRAGLVIP